jgi:hypothetical protein
VQWFSTFSDAESPPNGWTIGAGAFNTTDGANWNPVSFGPPTECALFSVNLCSGTTEVPRPIQHPGRLVLSPAFPNPFVSRTRFDYSLDAPRHLTVTVHDLQGRRVATLRNEELGAGRHSSTWDGTTSDGGAAGAGVYFVRVTATGAAVPQVKARTIVMTR